MSRRTYPTILAVCLAALAVFTAAPASAKPGHVDFTPANTQHWYEGPHGIFTADAIYADQGTAGDNRVLWSLRLSESVRALVLGDIMACGAYVEGMPGYADNHPQVPADYQLHSMVPDLQLDTLYRLMATCAFTAQNGSTTAPGRVDYTVEFVLHSS